VWAVNIVTREVTYSPELRDGVRAILYQYAHLEVREEWRGRWLTRHSVFHLTGHEERVDRAIAEIAELEQEAERARIW
jgi:ssRNA-specific RNase YbeY (16S rRNA maturation enzyme)